MLNQQLVQEKIIDYCSVHCGKYQIDNHNAEECQNCPLYDARMELICWENYFVITTVHRDDLEGQGFDTSNVDDDVMKELADKMADAYMDSTYWIDLKTIAECLSIPTIGEEDEDDEDEDSEDNPWAEWAQKAREEAQT